ECASFPGGHMRRVGIWAVLAALGCGPAGGGGGGGGAIAIGDFCSKASAALCAWEVACNPNGMSTNEADCRTTVRASCEQQKNAAEVAAGRRVYDGQQAAD